MEEKAIEILLYRYPQLMFMPKKGLSETVAYQNITKRGQIPQYIENTYDMSEQDVFCEYDTPAGKVDTFYIYNRNDFERLVEILAYRGEETSIPESMGAVTIRGLNNWRKIKKHQSEYLLSGGEDWQSEFRKFIQVKENYQDTIILLSHGSYSNVAVEKTGYDEETWIELSKFIRQHHELSHVISKKLFPENENAIRDEIIADAMGLRAAFGRYDTSLARLFLGIESDGYRWGGRLENYVKDKTEMEAVLKWAEERIDILEDYCMDKKEDVFNLLISIEKEKIAY